MDNNVNYDTVFGDQKESQTNKCRCGKEIEKPYIRCDDCQDTYLTKLIKTPKK